MFGDIYYTNMLLYIEKESKSKENKKIKDLQRERKEREREQSFILITVCEGRSEIQNLRVRQGSRQDKILTRYVDRKTQ